ncbi:MAG: DUF423 domain-containing protein [Pseudomonas fluorescens]|nr:MAG: DUF423 domain-containing protein [Pseudomonas fluorescens]
MVILMRVLVGISGFLAVAMGAVGAHAVADVHGAEMVRQAALYHLVHTVVLLLLMERVGRIVTVVRILMALGILLFSGLIYVKYMVGMNMPAGMIPAGGICLMLGWLGIALMGAVKR